MNLQVVVIAHGNGIAAVRRHVKYWEALKSPILVVSPENDHVESNHECLVKYQAQRNGPESILRLRLIMDTLSKRTWDACVIYEYDSFSLAPFNDQMRGFYGIVFRNDESPKFMAPRYANPPWFFDRHTFDVLYKKAKECPCLIEDGEADRWFSALAFLAGVPLFDYTPKGFSCGEIVAGNLPHLRAAIYEGSGHFHGVKQASILSAVEQYWDEAHPTKGLI